MERPIIWKLICLLILISLASTSLQAQDKPKEEEKAPLFSGIAVSADVVGFAMKAVGAKFANMEVGARINLLDKFFPTAELGIGDCSREGAETGNTFSTTSPYMRFGLDYNFNKKHNGNRIFGLVRYGFSNFKYDVGNEAFTDPVYGTSQPFKMESQKATGHWIEIGAAVETKLWAFIRLGWSVRYKFRAALSCPDEGEPYFIPGFGKNDTNGFGGTVNLIFDVGKGSFNFKKKGKS